jgi:large conductance mechanosensitive channel
MWKEFKEFAMKGNVVDMAVGIIIGAAFGKIVNSLVNDIIMPSLGLLLSGMDFSNLSFILKAAIGNKPAVLLSYGMFLNTVLNFVIVAFAIFLLIKGLNALKKKEAAKPVAPPAPSRQEILLAEIRDLLKTR